jgi:hypothetical protein
MRVFVIGDKLVSNHIPLWEGNGAVKAVMVSVGTTAADILVLPRGPRKRDRYGKYTIAIVHAG